MGGLGEVITIWEGARKGWRVTDRKQVLNLETDGEGFH